MGRYLGWALGGVLLLALSATTANAQVHVAVGVNTGNVGAVVAVGPPPVYVADPYYAPVYYPRPYYVRYDPYYVPYYDPYYVRVRPYRVVRYTTYYDRYYDRGYYRDRGYRGPVRGWERGRGNGRRGDYVSVREVRRGRRR